MRTIQKFTIVCVFCQKESMCVIAWLPEGAFSFSCVNCGSEEIVKLVPELRITTKEQFVNEALKERARDKKES